jgi:alanine racemase
VQLLIIKRKSMDSWQKQRAWIEINHQALAHNTRQLKSLLSPQTALMAVVKADAYGHGAIAVAQTVLANGASWLAVATVPEGIELRQAGITAPLLLLGAAHTAAQIQSIAQWDLQPTIINIAQAMNFQEELPHAIPVHLKIDTGMSRLGTSWQEATEFCQAVQQLPALQIASIYSHLATADDVDQTVIWQQHQRFEQVIADLRPLFVTMPLWHLANSAGLLLDERLHYDLVRPGLALYGFYPEPHLRDDRTQLQPVLTLKARITQIKKIPAGTGVSYGHRFIAPQEMSIAIVGIGYADGVPRQLSQQLVVLIAGQRIRQIGTITMDQIILDVSGLPPVQVGDIVTLLSNEITADDWAQQLGTISWEILCGFQQRLPRLSFPLPEANPRPSALPNISGGIDLCSAALYNIANHLTVNSMTKSPSDKAIDPELYKRLQAEAKSPFKGLRKFFYLAFAGSGSIGGVVFLARLAAGRDLANTIPSLALQIGVVALMIALYKNERGERE